MKKRNKESDLETKKARQLKNNHKAFTLIELLAVIIILAILMIIAIPSVSNYIGDSRKKAYIASAKSYINGARFLVNSGKLSTYDTSATYYIPARCVKMENETDSPYGKWKDRYVGVVFDGNGFKYYWESTDMSQMGIYLVAENDLDVDKIETGVKEVLPDSKIDNTSKVLVLSDNCLPGEWIDKTAPVVTDPDDDNLPIRIDDTTWYKEPFTFRMRVGACWNTENEKKKCGVTVTVINDSDTVLSDWVASFILPAGISITSNSISFASISMDGNKINLTSSPDFWNFVQPHSEKSGQIQIEMNRSTTLVLDDAIMNFTFLTDEIQQGEVTGGVSGNAEDMNIDLSSINVELKRNNYWGSGGNYSAIYGVIVTNLSDNDITDWSFNLVLPPQITGIEAWNVIATNIGNTTYKINSFDNYKNIPAHGSVTINSAFQFNMTDINAMPGIE